MIESTAVSILTLWLEHVKIYSIGFFVVMAIACLTDGIISDFKETACRRKALIPLQYIGFSFFTHWLFMSLYSFGIVADWLAIPLVSINVLGGILWWKFKSKELG